MPFAVQKMVNSKNKITNETIQDHQNNIVIKCDEYCFILKTMIIKTLIKKTLGIISKLIWTIKNWHFNRGDQQETLTLKNRLDYFVKIIPLAAFFCVCLSPNQTRTLNPVSEGTKDFLSTVT